MDLVCLLVYSTASQVHKDRPHSVHLSYRIYLFLLQVLDYCRRPCAAGFRELARCHDPDHWIGVKGTALILYIGENISPETELIPHVVERWPATNDDVTVRNDRPVPCIAGGRAT
jgi:hypothetical protein